VERLSGLDSMFLSMESPSNLFHVGALAVLDPSTAPPGTPAPAESIRRVLEQRIHLLPPLRRRPASVLGGLARPRWEELDRVDLDQHVNAVSLPTPGGVRELTSFVATEMSRPLPRDRPLWALHVLDGLDGGEVAVVAKIHHAAADGLTGAELTAKLTDLSPHVQRVPVPFRSRARPRVPGAAVVSGLTEIAGLGPRAAGQALRAAGGAARLRQLNRSQPGPVPPPPFGAPRCPPSATLTEKRAIACAVADGGDMEVVRGATGATVHEVLMALVAAALRRRLHRQRALPETPLVAFVPVSVRPEGGGEACANQLSGMLVSLATDVEDRVERLVAIKASSRRAKHQDRVLGQDLLGAAAGLAAPAALEVGRRVASLTRLTSRRPLFNVVVSSFPGPPVPLYCGGSRLVAYHPFGPVVDGAAVNVTAMSYEGHLDIGVLTCPEAVPNPEGLAHAMTEELARLCKSVGGRAVPLRSTQ
jgi:diacylglycerol O-acyltransferase / wax synthase